MNLLLENMNKDHFIQIEAMLHFFRKILFMLESMRLRTQKFIESNKLFPSLYSIFTKFYISINILYYSPPI